uniref:Uncharacterized protein n=1 Tax=Globodera rostochiensis TaxID=31243 RepID=A0A914GTD1_GLORO
MSDDGSNYFFVVLPSNVTDYADNATSKYRVHLPKPVQFRGAWVCGLYSIQYPHSWASTVGTVADQWIDVHYLGGRTVRMNMPKTSQSTTHGLQEYLNDTIAMAAVTPPDSEPRQHQQQQQQLQQRNKRSAAEPTEELRQHQQEEEEEEARADDTSDSDISLNKRMTTENFEKNNGNNDDDDDDDDDAKTDDGGSVVCTKTGKRIVCRRTKAPVPSVDEGNVQEKTTTMDKAAKVVPEAPQSRPLSHGEKLRDMVKERLKSQQQQQQHNQEQQRNEENLTEKAKDTTTTDKKLPTALEEEEKRTASRTRGKSLKEKLVKATPRTPTTTTPTTTTPKTTETPGTTTKPIGEEEKITTTTTTTTIPKTTHGEALADLLEKSNNEKDKTLHVVKTHEEAAPHKDLKSRDEKEEEEEEAKTSPNPPKTTHGDVLYELLEIQKQKKEREKELAETKTRADTLSELLKKSRTETEERERELATTKTRGEALAELLEKSRRTGLKESNADIQFLYRNDIDRFQVSLDDPEIDHLSMSQQLAYVLGFPNKERVEREEIAKYGVDLRGGFTSFAVYASGLTRSVILGNSLSSLLRIVATDGEYGQVVERIYDNPMFIPVQPREINELQIELRMMDGQLVPFDYGTVLITLVFKKVVNF